MQKFFTLIIAALLLSGCGSTTKKLQQGNYDGVIDKTTKKLIKKGELAKDNQKKFVNDLMKEAKKNTSEVVKILNDKIEYLAQKGEPLKEKQDKIIKDIASRAKETGTITEVKLKDIIKEAREKTRSVKDKISKGDERKIKVALEELDIPTREDLDEIRNKLDILTAMIDKEKTI